MSSAERTAPPGSSASSRTTTSHPRSASRFAATSPLWPAPMTTASAIVTRTCSLRGGAKRRLAPMRARASTRGRGLRQADLALEDLPGRALGQLVDEVHRARVLVGRDALLGEVAQLLGRGVGALLERHDGGDLLAERLVGDA